MIKRVVVRRKKVLLRNRKERVLRESKYYFVRDLSKDFQVEADIIPNDVLVDEGVFVSIKNNTFYVFRPSFYDIFTNLKRGAQGLLLRDIGFIVARAGITRDSSVLDAGTGSGLFACFAASIAKQVVSYDLSLSPLVFKNKELLGLDNLFLKEGDVYDPSSVSESGMDVFFLDVPEPWRAIATAAKVLRRGGFLAVYTPQVVQAQRVFLEMSDDFLFDASYELLDREWRFGRDIARPANKGVQYSALISFFRRV